MDQAYDRVTEDLGNIVALEHVNTAVPEQRLATIFYVMGMGFTRDPYLSTGIGNMWINLGRSQFHLPTGAPQVLRGHAGIVVPEREALLERLREVKGELDGTAFTLTEDEDFVEVTSPWGNRLRCFEPESRFGRINLGMPYLEFEVPAGTAAGIGRFYDEVFGSRVALESGADGPAADCSVGNRQELVFRETDRPIPDYDGHHIQVYLAQFSPPHSKLNERGLVFEESGPWQYRFKDIVDLDGGQVLFTLEHEVRSMTHPLYGRPLVNRNPELSIGNFAPGTEDWSWVSAGQL